MNQRAFRRALRYGFGRAILHLRDHDAARYRDDILAGCLHDWAFIPHLHERRADYMFEIVALTGERAFYRDRILAAVACAADDRDGHHVFALAWRFAEAGDETAREALDRALERLPFDRELAHHVIALHGSAGLARVVRLRLDRLDADSDAYDDNDVGHGIFWLFADDTGDDVERDALDRALERLPFDYWLTKQAIAFHGPAGLARVVRLRLDRLEADGETRAADEIVGWWDIDNANERWGTRAVAAAMREAGCADPRIKALWTDVRHRVAQGHQDWEDSGRPPPLTYEQAKKFLAWPGWDLPDWDPSGLALRGWMVGVPDDEWRQLAAQLAALPDDDRRWRRALRFLYGRRAYPGDPHRLIAIVRAARIDRSPSNPYNPNVPTTERVALDAVGALAHLTHPAARAFALELLETSKWTGVAAGLLARDYADGDLDLLASAFRRERSELQRHAIGNAILGIDERFAPAGAPPVLLLLYEFVPCFECRERILERLHAHAALPAAIAAECCFDADDTVRERIAELVPGACTGSGDRARSDSGIDAALTTPQ